MALSMQWDCNQSGNMLFNKEIEGLHDDGFEGSIDEHRIFTEVFFGNDNNTTSKRCLVTGVINFESDYSKQTDVPFCSNSESSVITSQKDACNVKEDCTGNTGPGCFSEGFSLSMRSDDADVKRRKLSVDKLSNVQPYLEKVLNSSAPLEGIISGVYQPVSHSVCHNVTCRLVESCSQGVTSSCYLLKRNLETDGGGDIGNRDVSKCRSISLDGSERKEVVATKVIASPVSQESHSTKLLVANPSVTAANMAGSLQYSKPRWKETSFVKLDIDEIALTGDSMKDPRFVLRYHINHLLRSAGWEIGRRKRSSKFHGLGEFVYRSPQGRPIREFHRAWDLCGQSLFDDANSLVQVTDGKQWADSTQFWSDLSDTFLEIEELLKKSEPMSALAHVWCLLDPFANVVFIDKMIGALRAGKEVRSRKSFVIDSSAKCDVVLASQNVDLSSFAACGSDSTCDHSGSSLFEVPVSSANTPIMLGWSDMISPHKDSNTSFPSFGRERTDYNRKTSLEVTKDVSVVSSEEAALRFNVDAAAFAANFISKRKAHKKSKKINEIKQTKLYQNGTIGPSTSYKDELHDADENYIEVESIDIQESLMASSRSSKKLYLCSFQGQNDKKQFRTKKFRHKSGSSKESVKVTYDTKHLKELNFENSTAGSPTRVNSECLGSQTWRHGNKSIKLATQDENGQKRSMTCQLKDDDLLISVVIKSKSFRSTTKQSSLKHISCKSKSLRKRKSQKGSCRLLPRSLNKGGKHFMEGKWSAFAARTVLSWLIHSGTVSLNEVIQYRNPKDDAVLKDGLVIRDGILCRCCGEVLSISEFKIHSGFRLNRPCLNLFMESGKPFTLCQLEAWSAEYKARKSAIRNLQVDELDQNDDSCGLCGDGGELICCDNCPSTFHQACLFAEELPEGSWYCPDCTCRICGEVANEIEASKSPGALKCLQCERKYHEACMRGEGINGVVASDTWFCGQSCQEVYSGLHSRVGFMKLISDGFSWTLLRCIHGDQKVHSAQRFVALKAECNSKLAVALTIMEECFLPMVDPRTGIDMIPHVVYNWGSQFARLNYHGFYTAVLEKDDVLMSVASIRIHGVTVAEMPLIATCSKYRRQGMCRRLMSSIEEMLKSFMVEKLVISAIPDLVETWTVGFGFQLLEDNERQSMRKINLMVFPGTIWLKKPLLVNQAAVQRAGSTHASPSGPDGPTEKGDYSQLGPVVDPVEQFDGSSCAEEVEIEIETETGLANCKKLQVSKDMDSTLHKHFSNLCFEESASTSMESRREIVCHVESLETYDERQLTLNEQPRKTHVFQENEKHNCL